MTTPLTPPETPSTPRGDYEKRVERLNKAGASLPPFNPIGDVFVWSEDDKERLRAACALRFGEELRTESLFCIAAMGVRIWLSRNINDTRPAPVALSEEDAVPIIALTLYERDPATSNGLALSWRQCEDIFPERINQVLGDAEAAYRALTAAHRGR